MADPAGDVQAGKGEGGVCDVCALGLDQRSSLSCASCAHYIRAAAAGQLTLNGARCGDDETAAAITLLRSVVKEGDRICYVEPGAKEPPVPAPAGGLVVLRPDPSGSTVAAADCGSGEAESPQQLGDRLVGVNKPCGVPVHASGAYFTTQSAVACGIVAALTY